MKKNTMMRIASTLLIAVLLTTCAIGATFAKYATAASAEDSARVAYWGFNGTTFTIENLFTDNYTDVIANDSSDVIAPGTTGSSTFYFKPQNETAPEVAYKITVDTEGSEIADELVANTNIQFKLDDGEWGTFAALLTAIEELSTEEIAANNFDESWGATTEHTVHWQWIINDVSDADDAQNIKDTELGNVLAANAATVKLVISILAEQVDSTPIPAN